MNDLSQTNSRGSTFISIMLFGFILFLMSASFLLLTTSEYKLNHRSYDSVVAINLAEAGADFAIWALNLPGTDPEHISTWGGTNPKTKSVPSFKTADGKAIGDFEVMVFDSDKDNPFVESTSYVPDMAAANRVTRTVNVQLARGICLPFNKGVFFGGEYVHIKAKSGDEGDALTDSYDSRIGAYGGENVGDRGDITTYGNLPDAIKLNHKPITIRGNLSTGPLGDVEIDKKWDRFNITGEIYHNQVPADSANPLPAVNVPSKLTSLPPGVNGQWTTGDCHLAHDDTGDIPAGNWKLGVINLDKKSILNIHAPAKIYLTGFITEKKSIKDEQCVISSTDKSDINIIGDPNQKVEFYLDGNVELTGKAAINDGGIPGRCLIYGTSECEEIKINGDANFFGAVYAPAAHIHPKGVGDDRFGAFVGRSIQIDGKGNYHYDEALSQVSSGSLQSYRVTCWQEK